ncbi:hypothetical protein H5410_003821 [Solanum commersonii]|uniref:Uncharacterized protein n=1 Tax=Solanum commersonii TaxID=4109 RepID=A0A9J6B625_SOLCO|nr:hypothetical protein H5410_003821 [Solanum commersonii]
MPINVRAILRHSMMKFRNNMRWRFCYGGLITHFLRSEGIKEKTVDMTVAYHPDLTGKLVDVTRTKALDTSHGLVLFAQERQARDDSVMEMMFAFLCKSGPSFLEPLDDDEVTADEAMDDDKEGATVNGKNYARDIGPDPIKDNVYLTRMLKSGV